MSETENLPQKQMAMIHRDSHLVENIIVVSGDGFEMADFILTELKEGTVCQPGMYYNPDDRLFYYDAGLTQLTPPEK